MKVTLPVHAKSDAAGAPTGSAAARLATGGLSVLVALALVVNLTCRAAGPVIGSLRETSSERLPLRQLTLAIHRVVRRLIHRRKGAKTAEQDFTPARHGLVVRPRNIRSAGVAPRGLWTALLAHLIDLPPPARA